jgi:hypothetical protein
LKFKLDENIGRRGVAFLSAAGHDVRTVHEQRLGGAGDEAIFEVCASEGRILVTLDHDFGQVLRFPPNRSAGIVILELPPRPFPDAIERRLRDFLAVHASSPFQGGLWIVGPGRVRIHDSDS